LQGNAPFRHNRIKLNRKRTKKAIKEIIKLILRPKSDKALPLNKHFLRTPRNSRRGAPKMEGQSHYSSKLSKSKKANKLIQEEMKNRLTNSISIRFMSI
jgi:hypothetical protein